jgi:branched-chain amino acid transport system substrate-binding protein
MSDAQQGRTPDEPVDQTVSAPVSRRNFLKLAGIAGATVAVGGGLGALVAGCGDSTDTGGSTATSAGSGTSVAVGATLKIGYLTDYSIPQLINSKKVLDALIEGANNRGGWDVGGSKVKLELVALDGKSEAATARSAVQKFVSEEKVDVVIGDTTGAAWVNVTEGAKKLALLETMLSDIFNPSYKYTFAISKLAVETAARVSYLPTYMGIAPKKWVGVSEDNIQGQTMLGTQTAIVGAQGYDFESVTYSASTNDFTAVATKVISINPDVAILGMSDAALFQIMRSLKSANYKGVAFCPTDFLPIALSKIGELSELDGMVAGCMLTATSTPNTICKELMEDYTAKYGQWDDPDFMGLDVYYTYRAAVQQAGSFDSEAVANVLAAGFENEGPHGKARMVARPDAEVPDRTVCQIMEMNLATVTGGELSNIKSIGLEDVAKYTKVAWAIPTGPPA